MEKGRYAAAGVDIDAGNRLVEMIKPMLRQTARPGADAEIGGFGGLFDLKSAGFSDPILVAATDGVGTKVKIAIEKQNAYILDDSGKEIKRPLVVKIAKPVSPE